MKSNHFIFIGAALAVLSSLYPLLKSDFTGGYINMLPIIGGAIAVVATLFHVRTVASNEKEYEEESVLLLKSLKALIDENAKLSIQPNQNINLHSNYDHFCVVTPYFDADGKFWFEIQVNGNGFVNDTSIEIIDLEKLKHPDPIGNSTIEDFRLASNVIKIKKLPMFSSLMLPYIGGKFYGTEWAFDISFTTSTGTITEYLRMYRIDNEWKTAIRIKNDCTGQLIYETINAEINRESLRW